MTDKSSEIPRRAFQAAMKQTTDADSSDPILEAFRARLLDLKALEPWHEKRDQAFFVADSGRVQRQLARWKEELPDVSPYYGQSANSPLKLPEAIH